MNIVATQNISGIRNLAVLNDKIAAVEVTMIIRPLPLFYLILIYNYITLQI